MAVNMLERFGILDGGIGYLIDKQTKENECIFNNANNFTLTTEADSVQAKECGENAIEWSLPKTGELSFESQTTSFVQLSLALGSSGLKLSEDATDFYKRDEKVIELDGKGISIKLEKQPKTKDLLEVCYMTRDREPIRQLESTEYTYEESTNTVTVNDSNKLKADYWIGCFYMSSIPAGKCYTFKVPAKGKNKARELRLDVLGTSRTDNEAIPMQFVFYQVKPQEGIEITFNAEEASTFTTKFTVLSDASRKVDDNNGFFEVILPYEEEDDNNGGSTIVPDIQDLSATENSGDVNLTWSIPSEGTITSLKLQARTESGSFADVNTDGTTGINIPAPLSTLDTSVTVTGLTGGTKYYFRLVINDVANSNTTSLTLA